MLFTLLASFAEVSVSGFQEGMAESMTIENSEEFTVVKRKRDTNNTPLKTIKRFNFCETPDRHSHQNYSRKMSGNKSEAAINGGNLDRNLSIQLDNRFSALLNANNIDIPEGEKTNITLMKYLCQAMTETILSNSKREMHEAAREEAAIVANDVQACLIEDIYKQDHIGNKFLYTNLRVTTLPKETNDKKYDEIVVLFAKEHGVDMKKELMSDVFVMNDTKDGFSNIKVKFTFTMAREKLRYAIFKYTNMTKDLKRSIQREQNEGKKNMLKASLNSRNISISEDLTPKRFALLEVVKKTEDVKTAYTRNVIIHAIYKESKVKIYSALDLFKIGRSRVPTEALKLPGRVIELSPEVVVSMNE